MVKKILVGTAILLTTGAIVFGTDAYSYLRTSARKVRHEVKASVPLDFEIERARQMVADLVPDIQKNMHIIAQEEVEIEDLRDQIARAEKNLAAERERLLVLRKDAANGDGKFSYAGHKATSRDVKVELSRRFDRFQTAEATLKAKRQMLDAREKSLAAAREKLEGMFGAKRDLEVQVQNLEARLKMLQAAETTSRFSFDDSQLSRCKKTVQELRKRLDVAERILEQDGKFLDGLSEEVDVADDIVDQIDRYFGPGREAASARQASL